MIRHACAWVLVVLAASPVTAPFCACDLHELVAYAANATNQPSPAHVATTAVCVEEAGKTASPRISSREPATEWRDDFVMFPFRSVSVAKRDVRRPLVVGRSVLRRSARPTVLRV